MRNFKFLRKSERKSVGTTLALTVGSPSVHRRYSALKHLTFMLLFLLGSLNVWGAEGDVVVSINPCSLAGSNTSYGFYSNDNWAVNTANNSAFGTNAKTSNNAKLKLSNNTDMSDRNTAIASALATYTEAEFTVNTQYVAALIGKTVIENVGKFGLTYGGTNGDVPDDVWVLASTNSGVSYSVVGHSSSISAGMEIEFASTIASAQYAVVFKGTAAFGLKSTPTITFYEGTTGSPDVCADPVFDPNGGSVASGTKVTITTETEDATIYYTMGADPVDPTSSSDGYAGPIEITANTTIKAIAIKEGNTNSNVVSKSFTVAAALTDEEFAWSAVSYDATLNAENTYPSLTNTNSLEVTYQSTDENVATIDAEGTITLKKAGTTTIKAIFAGNSTYVAKTVEYSLTASKGAGWIDYDFSQISGFSSWGSSYTKHTAEYTEADVVFASANKSSQTITDVPVTKGNPVELKLKSTYATREIEAVEFVCTQWSAKAQTITLNYSTDGGENYNTLTPSVTSTNFTISSNSLPSGTNAVKITFNSQSNQVGIASASFKLKPLVNSEVTITNPVHGTITVMNGETPVDDGTSIQSGTVLTVSGVSNNAAYRFGTIRAYKTDDAETTVTITNGALTMPTYPITITADETQLYSIEAASVTGGTLSWEDSEHAKPTYVEAETLIQALLSSTAAGYEFVAFDIYKKGDNTTKVNHTDGLFEMPAYNVVISASFNQKADPEITLSQTTDMDFGAPAKGSANISKTFTVTGANLESGLTVAITSEDNSKAKFSVDVDAITAADAMAEGGVVVTVTTTPDEAGDYLATITVDDGENGATAKSFDVLLSVQETYTAKWYVNGAEQTGSTVTAVAGTALTFPTVSSLPEACTGLEFKGWLTSALAEASATEPAELITTTAGITMPEDDVDYYAVFAEEVPGEEVTKTYSYTLEAKVWSANGSQTLSNVSWTLANNGSSYNYDPTKGQQVGSGNNPASTMSLTTSGISGKITSVKIYTSGAKDINAAVAVSVNNVAYKYNNSTSPVAITNTNTGYEFTGSETGAIEISWAQTSSKALYFKQIDVEYATPSASTYANYVTTCVACSRVTLEAAEVEHGSIKLQQDSKDVTSVKTCDAAQTVNVVASPDDGYELSGVNLNGFEGANYNNGVISINQNASGTLTATATFALVDYAITYTAPTNGTYTIKVGDADAVSANTVANMGQTITLAAEAAEGYLFTGWTVIKTASSEAITVTNNTFTMPAEAVTVAANFVGIYSVTDFIAIQDKGTAEYCIEGIVSYVKSLDPNKYTNAQYYISANGQRVDEIYIYNGKYLNGADFTSTSQLAEGDKVIVCGTWDGTNSRVNAANYLVSRVVGAHDSYEIVGDLGKSNFMNGEKWLNSYLSGLSVNDVYNTGYKVALEGVQFSADKEDEAILSTEDTKIIVTAKKNEATLAQKEFDIAVSAATLVSFGLKAGYKTEYYVGDELVKPTVIATLSDNSKIEEVATACTGYNMSVAGNYTVSVAFTYGNITLDGENGAEYQITVKKVFDNEDAPHTVAKAIELIEASAYQAKQSSTDYMWVRGKVVSEPNSSSTYYISDDGTSANQLTVWQGKYFTTDVSAKGNVAQGDEVILKATIVNYNGNQAELTASTVVYQLREPAFAIADIVAGDEFEAGYSEDLAVEPTDNDGDAEFTLSSGNTDAVTIVEGKLHAVAEGDAVITAHRDATANENALNYKEATTTFNVHVIAERTRYTVSFDADGGTGTDPVIANQLLGATVDLPENPYSKANSAFAGWLVNDGAVEITDGQFTMPEGNVTIKATWNVVATCAISFKVNGTEVATANAPQTAEFSLASVSHPTVPGFTWEGWSETEAADEVAAKPAIITSITPAAGLDEKVLYGIYSRLDDSDSNYGKYEKATAVAEGDYLIVCESENVVFDGSLNTLDATGNYKSVTITDGVVTLANADNYVFTVAEVTGGYSIKSASNKYIGCTGSSNGFNESTTQVYTNTITLNNDAFEVTSSGGPKLQYYKSGDQSRFRYYKTSQKAVALYKKNNGVTKYTSSPVEKVTITFDANGGEGGCQKAIINKGAEFTICENVPTKSHSEFAGWKNGDDEYIAGQTYTFDADITLTAQWNDAPTFTVTFDKNEGTGTAETIEDQYAGDEITLPAALTKDQYTFQGWKYDGKLYKAGAQFTMVAANIEFVAQFRTTSVPTNKMSLVTDASALATGMQITLGCSYVKDKVSYFAMAGDLGSNKYMASVTENVSLADNIATYPNTVVVLTLEQVENGWKITKDGTNYLTLSGSSDLKWDTKANATAWAISFEAGNVKIAAGDYWIQYNVGSNTVDPRFKPYSSNQKQIQLFGQAIVVSEDASISDLGYTEGEAIVASGANVTLTIDEPTTVPSITAKNGATVVIEKQTTAESVVVEDGSKIVANAKTTTPTVYFSTTMGSTQVPGSASELGSVEKITLATGGEIIYDLTLGVDMSTPEGAEKAANQWHAFTLPFPVDAINGIYNAANDQKLTNEVDYAIMDYHGDIRANGDYGWKKYRGILQPGVFYLMTVNGDIQTFRFKAAKTGAMTQTTSMGYKAYNGSGDPSKDFGWNGIGNPAWVSGTVAVNVQVLDPYTYTYQTLTSGTNLTVSTPFFYNAGGSGEENSIVMQDAGTGANYAPARTPANEIKNVAVSFGNEVFRDKIYISASEDALNTYEQDKDLVRMIMSNTPKVAQIFGNAYGMKLSMVNAPMVNDQATYGLTLYAPNAGAYTIAVPEMENADIYLTYEGSIIWNLSMGEYTSDFAKGNNEGYGLLLVKKAPQVTTGVENAEANETGVQKVIINEHVYILRAEQMYDVTGKLVK